MLDKLIPWLEKQIGEAELLVLEQSRSAEHSRTHTIEQWRVRPESNVTAVATEIDEAILRETSAFSGAMYQLIALAGGKTLAQMSLRPPTTKAMRRSGDYEDVTVALLDQCYRHQEAMGRTLVGIAVGNTQSLLNEIKRLSDRNEENERRLDAVREAHERTLDKTSERLQAQKKFENNERRIDEFVSTVRIVLPYIVNAISKKLMLPTGDVALLEQMLLPVMESLTQEQLVKLQQVLTGSQITGLLGAWELLKKKAESMNDEKSQQSN